MDTSLLSPIQIAAKCLAHTASLRSASRQSGISVEELRRIKKSDPEFRNLVLEYTTASTLRNARKVERLVGIALKVLKEELSIPNTVRRMKRGSPRKHDLDEDGCHNKLPVPNSTRVRAAQAVLDLWHKTKELYDTNVRLRDLEDLMLQKSPGPDIVDVEVIRSLPSSTPETTDDTSSSPTTTENDWDDL